MGNIKQTESKRRTYYLFNDMINIKISESNLLKIDKRSDKNVGDYESVHGVNPLYLIIGERDGYIEMNKGSKYWIEYGSEFLVLQVKAKKYYKSKK